MPESVKRSLSRLTREDEASRGDGPPGKDNGRWENAFDDIFGTYVVEAGADGRRPRVTEGGNDLLRYWRVEHDLVRLVVRNKRRATDTLKTGSFLLLIIDRGVADIELFDRTIRVGSGDALLLTAIEPLVFSTLKAFSGSWVELPIWWLIDLFGGGLTGARSRLDGRLASTIILRAVFSQLCAAGADTRTRDTVDLFGDVLRRCMIVAGRGMKNDDGQMGRIAQFVARNHRQEGLSPKDASRTLGCSVSSIHKYCASAGTSFGKMVTTTRISHAAYRLAREDRRIAEIAYECGFASVSHFCRTFKSIYGVTPRSLRSRHSQ